ncbi:hypothetical protein BHM03_00049679 [Ensete ventricosum]|nr:hypothetical protein BHM03_00049679 [Ensete ventricosum]
MWRPSHSRVGFLSHVVVTRTAASRPPLVACSSPAPPNPLCEVAPPFPLRTTILIPHARIHSHVSIIFWASLSTQKPPINPVADKTNPPIAHTPACRYNATPSRSLPLGNGSHSGAHRESRPSPRGRVGLPQPTCFVTGPAAPDRVVVHAKFPLPTTPTSVVSTTGGSPGPTCRKRLREGYQECAASGHSDAGMRMCGRRSSVYYTHGVASRLIVRAAREKSPPSNKSSY